MPIWICYRNILRKLDHGARMSDVKLVGHGLNVMGFLHMLGQEGILGN